MDLHMKKTRASATMHYDLDDSILFHLIDFSYFSLRCTLRVAFRLRILPWLFKGLRGHQNTRSH